MFTVFGVEITKKHILIATAVIAGLLTLVLLLFGVESLLAATGLAFGSVALSLRRKKQDKVDSKALDANQDALDRIPEVRDSIAHANEDADSALASYERAKAEEEGRVHGLSDTELASELRKRWHE